MQYVGETGREFKMRLKEHLGYVRNSKLNEPTGLHFNLPEPTSSDELITA